MTDRKLLIYCATAVLLLGCGGGGGGNDDDDGGGDGGQANQAPQISGLADVTLSANEPSDALSFSVSDDAGADAVTLTATSSDTDLLPEDDLVLGGSGGDRTLTLTPAEGALGTATVTVTATDAAGLDTSTSFEVTVETQQVSFGSFFRETFAEPQDGAPRDLNSRSFEDDTTEGEFDDLIEDS